MKKILSSIITVVAIIIGALYYINDEELDIKGLTNKFTTASIENTKEDKDLINADTNSENYAFVNGNKTELTREDRNKLEENGEGKFWADYPDLDRYGRAGEVTALVTYDSVKSHSSAVTKRPSFDWDTHIAGEYKNGKYNAAKQVWTGEESNNQILQLDGYRGYIYNKSHSLAWSLGGDMETHNLTLGTRAQNVGSNSAKDGGGMGYSETQIRNKINDNPETKVYYQVTSVYKDKELLPRGSHVRAYSVNDNGNTINLNVWVSNTQKGVTINYKDGTYNIK
ncbi:endonuclease [Staphylococcus xylosus]|uniref:DNA/RNA non-specific endonuclease n=1 Tax=Staphylococcus xylosus TaxID=1288 RepID=UPI000E6A7FAF|nr:DNA/RNA non-specific endonuclease [Staphylococcus xylosus]RIM88995.1 endonuclease [Staphylococcus xylosus]